MLNDSDLKKIMIVTMPRSGSHVLQMLLSWKYKIPNLLEPFNSYASGFDPIRLVDPHKWAMSLDKGVFKLMGRDLYNIDIRELLTAVDHSVIIVRSNRTDCCVSTYYASMVTGVYHYRESTPGEKFQCPLEYARKWIKNYHKFQTAMQYIISSDSPYSLINYEDFLSDKLQYVSGQEIQLSTMIQRANIPFISTNFPYHQLCLNYQEINELILTTLSTESSC